MIAAAWLTLRIALELVLGCHCDRWTATEFGERCTVPLDYPRCELVSGWHPIAFGIDTCTRGDCR